LVPDEPGQITSNHGWGTRKHQSYLQDMCALFKGEGMRVSTFVDPVPGMVDAATETGDERVELYTESYARDYVDNPERALAPYLEAAKVAQQVGLGLNAGHDLDLHNLRYFNERIPGLLEVSIGHALIADALYLGLEETIRRYNE